MRVIGAHRSAASPRLGNVATHEVVFVQVTNPERRPMRLTKLEYAFASQALGTVSEGELSLAREVPAGSAIVVEVPLDLDAPMTRGLTLSGKLTATVDESVRNFSVSAPIQN